MELEGTVWKEGKFWFAEVPSLDLLTQGKTRKNALEMALDATMELMRDLFPEKVTRKFGLHLYQYGLDIFGLEATDNRLLLGLALRRQREKSGLTIREVALRLGSRSPTAYSRYEKGSLIPSINKFDQLLQAVNPERRGVLVR